MKLGSWVSVWAGQGFRQTFDSHGSNSVLQLTELVSVLDSATTIPMEKMLLVFPGEQGNEFINSCWLTKVVASFEDVQLKKGVF